MRPLIGSHNLPRLSLPRWARCRLIDQDPLTEASQEPPSGEGRLTSTMRWTSILLALALAGTSCDTDASRTALSPEDALTAWSPPSAYSYEVESSCGERTFIGRYRIHVRSRDVTAVTALDHSARAAIEAAPREIPTVEDLLEEALEAERAGADRVMVRRTDGGRPHRIAIDYDANAIDDEACYVIRSFASAGAATRAASTEAAIYAAVIRRAMREGAAGSTRGAVYVVDGPVKGAGMPRGDVYARPRGPFEGTLIDEIQQTLGPSVPPLRLVRDVKVALPENSDNGAVGDNKAVLLLGDIGRTGADEAHVPITWWCDKCSRWLTYVVIDTGGGWRVRGIAGPETIS